MNWLWSTRPPQVRLDVVVTDPSGGVQRGVDVGLGDVGDQRAATGGRDARGVLGPHPGVAVGLQFKAHGARRRSGRPGLHPPAGPEQLLDVVAVLVGDDVGTRERTACGAEPGLQLLEEPQVEVDAGVVGTVEGPHRGGCVAASGGYATAEERGGRALVGLAGPRKLILPVPVEGVGDGRDLAVELRVRVAAAAARLPDRGVVGPLARRCPRATELRHEQVQDQPDDADAAAAQRHPPAQRTAAARAAQVPDVGRVEVGTLVETHGCLLAGSPVEDPRIP